MQLANRSHHDLRRQRGKPRNPALGRAIRYIGRYPKLTLTAAVALLFEEVIVGLRWSIPIFSSEPCEARKGGVFCPSAVSACCSNPHLSMLLRHSQRIAGVGTFSGWLVLKVAPASLGLSLSRSR